MNLKAGVSPLFDGDKTVVDDMEKSNVLQNYFQSLFISSSQPNINMRQQTVRCLDDVTFAPIQVFTQLRKLSTKLNVTPDGLPSFVFKMLADVMAAPLSLIFTRSFEDGCVPSVFLKSIVTPVYKKGSRSNPENYRPISQEVIPCLIMERIIADKIMWHLQDTGLADTNQHGFTAGRSTSTQLLEVLHDWVSSRNNGKEIHCVYFDFSRAFDRVNHDMLLAKMSALGVGFRITEWCRSYLSGRLWLSSKLAIRFLEKGDVSQGFLRVLALAP